MFKHPQHGERLDQFKLGNIALTVDGAGLEQLFSLGLRGFGCLAVNFVRPQHLIRQHGDSGVFDLQVTTGYVIDETFVLFGFHAYFAGVELAEKRRMARKDAYFTEGRRSNQA